MSGSLIPLTFFPKVVSDILSLLPFSSLIYTPVMIIVGKYDASQILQALLLQLFWLIVMVACLSWFGNESSHLSPFREVRMKKYQRMHLIFIRQYIKQIMEYKVDFVVGVLGVFLTQGLNLLFLNVIFQHIPSLEGWTFQEIAFSLWIFLDSQGIRSSLFWQSLGFRSTASSKRGVWQVSDSSYQSSLSHPRWDLSDWCLGWTFGRWNFTSDNGD